MIWLLFSLSVILAMIALAGVVLCALIVSKSASDSSRHVSIMHERWVKQQDRLLDRLMTINWENFAALEATRDGTEWGGQSMPGFEEGDDEPDQEVRDVFSRMRSLIDDTTMDERELIEEDLAVDEREKVES